MTRRTYTSGNYTFRDEQPRQFKFMAHGDAISCYKGNSFKLGAVQVWGGSWAPKGEVCILPYVSRAMRLKLTCKLHALPSALIKWSGLALEAACKATSIGQHKELTTAVISGLTLADVLGHPDALTLRNAVATQLSAQRKALRDKVKSRT